MGVPSPRGPFLLGGRGLGGVPAVALAVFVPPWQKSRLRRNCDFAPLNRQAETCDLRGTERRRCGTCVAYFFCLRTGRTEVFWRAQRAGGCTAADSTHTWNQGSYACARKLLEAVQALLFSLFTCWLDHHPPPSCQTLTCPSPFWARSPHHLT